MLLYMLFNHSYCVQYVENYKSDIEMLKRIVCGMF